MEDDSSYDSSSYGAWWQPLPVWLKAMTIIIAYPSAFFMAYLIFTGRSKSGQALIAFCVFAFVTLLHAVFDGRKQRSSSDGLSSFEIDRGG
jgi:hypothetical protein